jgi:hypothetical protein
MKNETTLQKILKVIFVITGLMISTYGLKDTGYDSEELYCIGPGLIVAGILIGLWFNDQLNAKMEAKRTIIKILELVFFFSGTVILCFGLKDTSWDAEEITIWGGLLLGVGYLIRVISMKNNQSGFTNTGKIFATISIMAILTFQSSIYSNSEDCNCESQLDDIERKIDYLD